MSNNQGNNNEGWFIELGVIFDKSSAIAAMNEARATFNQYNQQNNHFTQINIYPVVDEKKAKQTEGKLRKTLKGFIAIAELSAATLAKSFQAAFAVFPEHSDEYIKNLGTGLPIKQVRQYSQAFKLLGQSGDIAINDLQAIHTQLAKIIQGGNMPVEWVQLFQGQLVPILETGDVDLAFKKIAEIDKAARESGDHTTMMYVNQIIRTVGISDEMMGIIRSGRLPIAMEYSGDLEKLRKQTFGKDWQSKSLDMTISINMFKEQIKLLFQGFLYKNLHFLKSLLDLGRRIASVMTKLLNNSNLMNFLGKFLDKIGTFFDGLTEEKISNFFQKVVDWIKKVGEWFKGIVENGITVQVGDLFKGLGSDSLIINGIVGTINFIGNAINSIWRILAIVAESVLLIPLFLQKLLISIPGVNKLFPKEFRDTVNSIFDGYVADMKNQWGSITEGWGELRDLITEGRNTKQVNVKDLAPISANNIGSTKLTGGGQDFPNLNLNYSKNIAPTDTYGGVFKTQDKMGVDITIKVKSEETGKPLPYKVTEYNVEGEKRAAFNIIAEGV